MSRFASAMRFAVVRRIFPSSTRRLGAAAATGRATAATGRGRDGASAAAGRFAALAAACSTSRSTIRPPGPVPATLSSATPRSRAIRRARGATPAPATRDRPPWGPALPSGSGVASRVSGGGPAARACASAQTRAPSPGFWLRLGCRRRRGFRRALLRRRGRGRCRAPHRPPTAPRSRRRPAPTRPPATGSRPASPSSYASSSMFALSVSTSARMSPMATRSPALLQPADDLALLHGVGELRHEHVGIGRSARRRGGRTLGRRRPAERATDGGGDAIGVGTTSASRLPAYGIGTSRLVTRSGGASSSSKASRTTSVISSAATPAKGHPSCTTTQRCVSRTDGEDRLLVERADACADRGPRASMPLLRQRVGRLRARCAPSSPHVTIVTSRPGALHVRDARAARRARRRAPRPSASTSSRSR